MHDTPVVVQTPATVQEGVGGEPAGERRTAAERDLRLPGGQGLLHRAGGERAQPSLRGAPAAAQAAGPTRFPRVAMGTLGALLEAERHPAPDP